VFSGIYTEGGTEASVSGRAVGEIVYGCRTNQIESAELLEFEERGRSVSSRGYVAEVLRTLDDLSPEERADYALFGNHPCGTGQRSAPEAINSFRGLAQQRLLARVDEVIANTPEWTGLWFFPTDNTGGEGFESYFFHTNRFNYATGERRPCPRTLQHTTGVPLQFGFSWSQFPGFVYDPTYVWSGTSSCLAVSYGTANTYQVQDFISGVLTSVGEAGASGNFSGARTVLEPCAADPCAPQVVRELTPELIAVIVRRADG